VTPELPPWMKDDRPGGWVTAEYVMLPASTPRRKEWPKIGHTDSRGTEIQRLIGRSIRAAIDLSKIGPHTIALDCQVMQADGGTRTAAICGAYVALVDAVAKLPKEMPRPRSGVVASATTDLPARYDRKFYSPKDALLDQLAAVSVGVIDGQVRLDLDYADDVRAEVDMNVAYTAGGKFVEVQGSAEGAKGFDRKAADDMRRCRVQTAHGNPTRRAGALVPSPRYAGETELSGRDLHPHRKMIARVLRQAVILDPRILQP
jgi:ribonuclease PH